MNNNRTYTHEAVLALFETSTQTSINSFSKTTKWILIIFGANWSWGRACSVSVFCFLLLFAGKHRKTLTKLKTTQKTLPVSWTSQVCRYRRDWSKAVKSNISRRNIENCHIHPPGSFFVTFQSYDLKVSARTVHSSWGSAGTRKSTPGTRNENAYRGVWRARGRESEDLPRTPLPPVDV